MTTRTEVLDAISQGRYLADIDGEVHHIIGASFTHALIKTPHGHGSPRMVFFRELKNIRKEES